MNYTRILKAGNRFYVIPDSMSNREVVEKLKDLHKDTHPYYRNTVRSLLLRDTERNDTFTNTIRYSIVYAEDVSILLSAQEVAAL